MTLPGFSNIKSDEINNSIELNNSPSLLELQTQSVVNVGFGIKDILNVANLKSNSLSSLSSNEIIFSDLTNLITLSHIEVYPSHFIIILSHSNTIIYN